MELKKIVGYGLALGGLVVGTSFLTARFARATGVPGLVPVQGCATDSKGNALNGSQQVEFRLYSSNNASQGDALYTETKNVTFRSCVFSEMLHPTDLSIFEKNPSMYLGIKIGSDAELSPRFEVGASPYAVQARHAEKATTADNGVPPGTIVAFGGTTPPAGWFLCDGQVVDGATYPALASAIGVSWGNGGGVVGKFNLPDLRGRFLRGVDGAAGRDPDKAGRTPAMPGGNAKDAVGSVQESAFQSHSHSASGNLNVMLTNGSGANGSGMGAAFGGGSYFNFGVSVGVSNAGGTETRPINANVNYIIKY